MTQNRLPAKSGSELPLQPADVVLAFQLAAHAYQQALTHAAQLRDTETALRSQLSSFNQAAEDMALGARASEALAASEADNVQALEARLQAAAGEAPAQAPPTPGHAEQLSAFAEVQTELAERICAAKTAALKQLLRELDAAGFDAGPASDHEAAAVRSIDQLYRFDSLLRPEQRDDERLHALFLEQLELQEMRQDIDAAFAVHRPGAPDPGLASIDLEIGGHVVNCYQSVALAHHQVAGMYAAKIRSVERQLITTQTLLRQAQQDLRDSGAALEEASAALQQFMQMAADTVPASTAEAGAPAWSPSEARTITLSRALSSIPEEEDDAESSSDAATVGLVLVENTPWCMRCEPLDAGWQDWLGGPEPKASAGVALAASLLFPGVPVTLAGAPGADQACGPCAALA